MRLRYLFVACLLAVPGVAGGETVNLSLGNLAANGWKVTTATAYGGGTNASVTQTADYGASNFRFFTGPMPTAWRFQWAGISTDAFAQIPLASITSVKIRTFGVSGDNASSWQPPTFRWVLDTGFMNNKRSILWQPWANGNNREPGVWHEYDCATTGQWFVEELNVRWNSLAALKAAMPAATFERTDDLTPDWGCLSGHGFNVGNCPIFDEGRVWFGGARVR